MEPLRRAAFLVPAMCQRPDGHRHPIDFKVWCYHSPDGSERFLWEFRRFTDCIHLVPKSMYLHQWIRKSRSAWAASWAEHGLDSQVVLVPSRLGKVWRAGTSGQSTRASTSGQSGASTLGRSSHCSCTWLAELESSRTVARALCCSRRSLQRWRRCPSRRTSSGRWATRGSLHIVRSTTLEALGGAPSAHLVHNIVVALARGCGPCVQEHSMPPLA